jgi:hypothetical protein
LNKKTGIVWWCWVLLGLDIIVEQVTELEDHLGSEIRNLHAKVLTDEAAF